MKFMLKIFEVGAIMEKKVKYVFYRLKESAIILLANITFEPVC